MPEQFVEIFIGVHPADAEQVGLMYKDQRLTLKYVDWNQNLQCVEFKETIAFRWQERDEGLAPRDDTTYKVLNSEWLRNQISRPLDLEEYAHYKILFNVCGVLDLICKGAPPR
jgi:hypothetical protein